MVLIITVTVAIVVILVVYLKLRCRKASGESAKEGIAIGTIDGRGDHVHAEQNTSRGNYSAEDLEKTVEVTPNEAYVCTTCVITQTSEAHQPASGSVEDSYEDYGY